MMKKQLVAEVIILICFCVVVFNSRMNKEPENDYTKQTYEPYYNFDMHKEIVINLILQNRYEEAAEMMKNFQSIEVVNSTTDYPQKQRWFYWSNEYASGMYEYSSGSKLKAWSYLAYLSRESLPEELRDHFDAHFQEAYNAAKEAHDQEMIRQQEEAEKKEQAYIDYVNRKCDEITEFLKNKNYTSAWNLANDVWSSSEFSWDRLDDATHDLFFSLYNYAKGIEMVKEDALVIADINFNAVVRSDLPKSLRYQFDKDYKDVEEAYQIYWDAYMKEYYASQGSSSSSSYYSDDYDVDYYSDAEEFYYWHRDDFYDYEEAEDYFNEHH